SNPDWAKIGAAASKKRTSSKQPAKGKSQHSTKIAKILSREELLIQRLGAELTGISKPKYSTIGAREFVPYFHSSVTIEGIKEACNKFFKETDPALKYLVCDVLAGVHGPSCTSIDQIDVSLIHVRFIQKPFSPISSSFLTDTIYPESKFRKEPEKSVSLMMRKKSTLGDDDDVSSKPTPSLSLTAMMRVGRKINAESTKHASISVKSFNLVDMKWTSHGSCSFQIDEKILGTGGFRNAYSATSQNGMFKNKTWVLKRYKTEAEQSVAERQQSLEDHTKTSVQMVALSNYFSSKLKELNDNLPKFTYVKIFYGEINDNDKEKKEYVTIEEKIDGSFVKYLNNDGCCRDSDDELTKQAQSLAHFSFVLSQEKLLLTDIQGCGLKLSDPEIASSVYHLNKESLFCVGNFSRKAIKRFGMTHNCNKYCEMAGLQALDKDHFNTYDDQVELADGSVIK
uniref:Alpha-type protein kinase domain-containing protein n=1 Tax=Clytia hemisphaerica TaxID=252671 RepID=A0A7M5TWE5_9CNID